MEANPGALCYGIGAARLFSFRLAAARPICCRSTKMNRDVAQHKSRLLAIASGLLVLLVIGGGLLHPNAPATALTEAQARATREAAARQANATHDEATWQAFATYAPDKATQRAIQQLTATFLPTPTWFDAFATGEALDKMLTTSPTPGPTEPPSLYLQRPAGAGRLIGEGVGICGNQCYVENYWIEKTKDKFILVTAARRSDVTTGHTKAQVLVEWWSLNDQIDWTPPKGGNIFLVPVPAESVMIIDAIGEQLTLRTDDGTLLVFDVPSQQYISVPPPQLIARRQHEANGGTLFENSDVPFTRPRFSAANRWAGKNAQRQITVFAGAEGVSQSGMPLGTGVLAMVTSKGEPTVADAPQIYLLPEPVYRALRIFDVKGNQVALTDDGGGIYFFDLTTRQFFSQFDERAKAFYAPLFDPNLPISQATPAPVTPFAPPTPVSTSVYNAYP
jgi:hypothetical protein